MILSCTEGKRLCNTYSISSMWKSNCPPKLNHWLFPLLSATAVTKCIPWLEISLSHHSGKNFSPQFCAEWFSFCHTAVLLSLNCLFKVLTSHFNGVQVSTLTEPVQKHSFRFFWAIQNWVHFGLLSCCITQLHLSLRFWTDNQDGCFGRERNSWFKQQRTPVPSPLCASWLGLAFTFSPTLFPMMDLRKHLGSFQTSWMVHSPVHSGRNFQ